MFLPLYDLDYWLGLNDLASPGNWVWQNSNVSPNYTHWGNDGPTVSNGTTCAVRTSDHGLWYDLDCDGNFCFGCDRPEWNNPHALCETENKNKQRKRGIDHVILT